MTTLFFHLSVTAQLITGYWKGKIDGKNVALKIIKNGDSLTGTSYYYTSAGSYRRYSIKGYFDARDNSAVWWDDQLIEEKNSKRLFGLKDPLPYFSTADFNCPGGTKMYLDGKAKVKEGDEQKTGGVSLQNTERPLFKDEWDFIIDNYTVGGNDRELIDSIGRLAFTKPIVPAKTEPAKPVPAQDNKPITAKTVAEKQPQPDPIHQPVAVEVKQPVTVPTPETNEQRFVKRTRQVMETIAITGDSIELRFYDNAEVDGDSIAIFLNNHLLYEHIRLTDKAYILKIAVSNLNETNELVMVAENLGSIPPNTSLMVALTGDKRYESRLVSTAFSSAVIRFVKEKTLQQKTLQQL